MPDLVELDAILSARQRIADVIQRTPIEPSRAVSQAVGGSVLLKCEHLQRAGSFKLRGAANMVSQIRGSATGVVCASAGNHAQGVALSAAAAGLPATVFMPDDAPLPKVMATRAYGAKVVLEGDVFDDTLAAAEAYATDVGAVFVPPFDHPDVIAGQGTIGLEILEEVPGVSEVVVPVGGGGLISGIAVALKSNRPDVRIVGVEPAGIASALASRKAGKPVSVPNGATIADGIAVKRPGDLTFAHLEALVDDLVTVTDEAIARAVLLLVERAKQVVEPAGAAGLAALLDGATAPGQGTTVVVLSGGNVDPLLLSRIIQSGLYEEARYLVIRTRIDDRPGSLVRLLGHLARLKGNVIAVEHHRLDTRLGLLEVEVRVELETRGPDHIRTLVATLRDEGYYVEEDLPPGV